MPLSMLEPPFMDIQRLQSKKPPKPPPVDVQSQAGPPNPVHVTSRMPGHAQPAKSNKTRRHTRIIHHTTYARNTYHGRTAPLHTTAHAVPPTHACLDIRNPARTPPNPQPTAATDPARMPRHTQPDTSSTIRHPRVVKHAPTHTRPYTTRRTPQAPVRNRVSSHANPTLIHPTHRIFTVDMGVITIQKINRPASPCCC